MIQVCAAKSRVVIVREEGRREMTPHPIHFDADSIRSIAEHVDSSYHFVLKLVCKDYRAVLPSRTESKIAQYTVSVAMLQWARANGCKWNGLTCASAAEGGHLEVLQWARANGCPWTWRTCFSAAKGGHIDVLQWARANGCPWNKHTCLAAASKGHLQVLQWARANGCPCA